MEPEKIIEVVYDYYKLDVSLAKSKDRHGEIIKAKHIAIYFMCCYARLSLENISWYFDYTPPSGHCSVIHARQSVKNRMDTENDYRQEIITIDLTLQNIKSDRSYEELAYQENDFYELITAKS